MVPASSEGSESSVCRITSLAIHVSEAISLRAEDDPLSRLKRRGSIIAMLVMLGFGVLAVVFLAVGIIQDWWTLFAAFVPAAFFGFQVLTRREEPFYGLVFGAVLVTLLYGQIGGDVNAMPAVTAVVLQLVLAAVFVDDRWRVAYVVFGVVGIGAVPVLWQDQVEVNLPVATVSLVALFVMGSGILLWFRSTLESSRSGYSTMFESAPTGMMEQDWSGADELLAGFDSEESLRHALASDDEFFARVVESVRVLRANQAMAELAELAGETDLVGGIRSNWITPEARHGFVEQFVAYRYDRPCRVEFETRSTRNRPLWVEVRTSSLPDPGKVLVLVDDVTSTKLQGMALEAEAAAKDQFIASVSHELRTPLTVVLGMLEELGSGTVDESMVTELVGMAASQAREMSYIIEDLLVEARAGIGGVSIQIGPVDVRATAASVVREADAGLALSGLESGRMFAAGDPVRVRQILRNLIMNATRYGGPQRQMVLVDLGDEVGFEVRDSGRPLPDAVAQRIFEPYQRAHHLEGSTTSIGLGLAVSRQLATMMGGDVRYHHDGESVFSLVLPKFDEPAAQRESRDGVGVEATRHE